MITDFKRRFNKNNRPINPPKYDNPYGGLEDIDSLEIHCSFGEEADPNNHTSEVAILQGTTIARGQNWYHQFGEE